jgi:hypothetical protein
MKKIYLLAISILISYALMAQITEKEEDLNKKTDTEKDGWKKGGIVSVGFSQVSLTNWSAGGENNVSVNALINLFGNYRKGKSTWDNNLDLGYGIIRQSDSDFIKSDDRIDFSSKYGREAFKDIYWAALLNYKTQFNTGYDYPDFPNTVIKTKISDFMAPAYIIGAIGLDYKPNDKLTVFVAPVTSKTTIVNSKVLSNTGKFGVEPGETIRYEFGGYLKAVYKTDIVKNVSLLTKLDLFSNYIEHPERIDVNWEVLIAMKINKFLTTTISTHLIYDDDTDIAWEEDNGKAHLGPKTQFKEVLNIGISCKF